MFDQEGLKPYIDRADYNGAVNYCFLAIEAGDNVRCWKTQLAYLCFLDDMNDDRHYNQAIKFFTDITNQYPTDANGYFWLGYIHLILYNNLEDAKKFFQRCIACDPEYIYVNLVMVAYGKAEHKMLFLQTVLQQQPTNYRSLIELADTLISLGQNRQAMQIFSRILVEEPFWETDYGVMNQYINDVFTMASHQENIRESVREKMALLSSNDIVLGNERGSNSIENDPHVSNGC